jgi:hypothetical protein
MQSDKYKLIELIFGKIVSILLVVGAVILGIKGIKLGALLIVALVIVEIIAAVTKCCITDMETTRGR